MLLYYNDFLINACDVHYLNGPVPPGKVHCHIWNIDKLLANLNRDIILCTSMGDWTLEQQGDLFMVRHGGSIKFTFPYPHHVKRWFLPHAQTTHPNIVGVPCGIMKKNAHCLEQVLDEDIKKDKLLYVNFNPKNHPSRPALIEHYMTNWSTCHMPEFGDNPDYFREMKRHKFVLCPPGIGIDCYRTWEALYMDCIPIVPQGGHHHFKMFPIVEVPLDKMMNLTKEQLENYPVKKVNHDYLQAEYWVDMVKGVTC